MYSLIFKVELIKDKQIPITIDLIKEEFRILSESGSNFISINDNSISIEDSIFSKNSIVDDEIRYKITVNNKEIKKEQVERNLENIDLKTIILLLESPHRSEYFIKDNVLRPIGPAKGKKKTEAGGAIEEYLTNILKKVGLNEGSYYLIIVNPIQFQTSLDCIHGKGLVKEIKEIRNLVWKNLWEQNDIRINFNKRLAEYKPIRIINACTEELQPYVNFELIMNKYKYITYTTTHPAITWNRWKEDIIVNKLR